jgi:hypothetical protein
MPEVVIAGLQGGDAGGLFLALALLRTDEQEVEHYDHQAHHDKGAAEQSACGRWGFGEQGGGEQRVDWCHGISDRE